MNEPVDGSEAWEVLRRRIRRLHRENGEPSTRDIARRTGHAVSHTTAAEVLRGDRLPRWSSLEPVVTALYGDRREFLRLWMAARDGEERSARSGPADDPAGGNEEPGGNPRFGVSDYFCYISQSKVEQMYATVVAGTLSGDGDQPSWVEALFRDGATFGEPHLLHGGALDRPQLMMRLRRVVTVLANQGAIVDLDDITPVPGSRYLHYSGVFRTSPNHVDDPAVQVVRLESLSRPGLVLDCSVRYFSEAVDGRYLPSSSSIGLLEGQLELALSTVFVLLQHTSEQIVGSPLYLKLDMG